MDLSLETRRDQLREQINEAGHRKRAAMGQADELGERRAEEEIQQLEHEFETLSEELRTEWGTPEKLPGLPAVPSWDAELLPDALRPWCTDIVERTQCPPEYPAIGAIVALGSVIGRGCGIRPKQHDDWTVVPNLWGATVGPPSAMKSPALTQALKPLFKLAHDESVAFEARDYDRQLAEAKLAALVKQRNDALRKSENVDRFRVQIEDCERKIEEAAATRRFLVYDSTVEKLGEILRDNPLGVLLYRDEMSGWLRSLDKFGRENDRAFYLESWNGDGGYVYDRIGRGTVAIEAACVSILGTIQPGPLSAYLRAALDGGIGDDGLIQRFQLLVYPDVSKEWTNVDRWPDSEAKRHAFEVFDRLARTQPSVLGAEIDEGGIPFLRFDAEAQPLFDRWRFDLEKRLRSGNEHPAIEAHLTKYRSLMPSLALIFHLADQQGGPVGTDAAERAIKLCTFLEAHARRAYACVVSSEVHAAKALLQKLRAGILSNPFQTRDVYRNQWTGLGNPDAAKAAIAVLEDFGWLRTVKERPTGNPNPRESVYIHPSLKGAACR